MCVRVFKPKRYARVILVRGKVFTTALFFPNCKLRVSVNSALNILQSDRP